MNNFRQQHLIILAIAFTLLCLFVVRNPSVLKFPGISLQYRMKGRPLPAKVVELMGLVKYPGIYYLEKQA